VGEKFSVTLIYAQAQAVVRVRAVHDNVTIPSKTMGYTNPSAYLIIQGQFGTVDRGAWTQTWSVSGVDAQPTLQFLVR
jgi:hypothetical protein